MWCEPYPAGFTDLYNCLSLHIVVVLHHCTLSCGHGPLLWPDCCCPGSCSCHCLKLFWFKVALLFWVAIVHPWTHGSMLGPHCHYPGLLSCAYLELWSLSSWVTVPWLLSWVVAVLQEYMEENKALAALTVIQSGKS